MGIRSMSAYIVITFGILLSTDASAALGVVNRRGVRKTRHIETQDLWLQGAIRHRELTAQKVAGEENVVDILSKNVKSEVLEKQVAELGFTQTTRRDVDDGFAGAHEQISSQSATKKNSAPQKAVGAPCNEHGINRSSSSSGRTATQHNHAEVRRVGWRLLAANAHCWTRSQVCPMSPRRSTPIKTPRTMDDLRWRARGESRDLRHEISRLAPSVCSFERSPGH